MTDTCEYVFDPDEDANASETSLDSVWECPRSTYVDTDYCVFHLTPESRELLGVTEVEVSDALVRTVEGTVEDEPCRFVGANFGVTVINTEKFGENAAVVDLSNTEFDGRFELDCDVVESDLLFDGTEFESFDAANVVFEGDVSFRGCSFKGRVNLDGARFEGDVSFEKASFDLDAEYSEAIFEGEADFRRSSYRGVKTLFKSTEFRGEVLMENAVFDQVDFTGADFLSDASFSGCTFRDEVKFQYASFERNVEFGKADFADNSTFRGVSFSKGADFKDASFQGWASLLNVELGDDVLFESVWFKSDINMIAESESNAVIDFTGARMGKASFEIQPYKPVILDFTNARIGDVTISMEGKVNNPLDNVRFVQTKFNGFDFSEYAGYLAEKDYVIHDAVVKTDEEPSIPLLEKTYRLAYEGSRGDADDIASEFEKKEAKYRRERYRQQGDTVSYYTDLASDYGVYVLLFVVLVGVAVAGFVFLDEIRGVLPV
jgi:uncharacterized protein YjbI with pentapeptide repeats